MRGVIPVDFGIVWCDVERWAVANICGAAPRCRCWINDHFAVSGNISEHISITWSTIVLPATANIYQVKLTLGSSSDLDIQGQLNLKIG